MVDTGAPPSEAAMMTPAEVSCEPGSVDRTDAVDRKAEGAYDAPAAGEDAEGDGRAQSMTQNGTSKRGMNPPSRTRSGYPWHVHRWRHGRGRSGGCYELQAAQAGVGGGVGGLQQAVKQAVDGETDEADQGENSRAATTLTMPVG